MIRSRREFAFGAALAIASCGLAHAQGSELVPYSDRILEVSRSLIADIRPGLDAHSREVVDSIVIEAPQSWITNASAEKSTRLHRVVEFNAGLLAVTDGLALAMIAEHGGYRGCIDEYSSYLVRIARKNGKLLRRGAMYTPVADFDYYTRVSRGACAHAHAELATPRNAEFRERMLDAVIATVVLHEIAHHVLGHVDSTKNGLVVQNLRESAADLWAIRAGVSANYDLRSAVPLFLFLAASGGGSIEDDVRSTHPSSLRRIRDLLVETRALLDGRDPIGAHLMDVSIDELNHTLN